MKQVNPYAINYGYCILSVLLQKPPIAQVFMGQINDTKIENVKRFN